MFSRSVASLLCLIVCACVCWSRASVSSGSQDGDSATYRAQSQNFLSPHTPASGWSAVEGQRGASHGDWSSDLSRDIPISRRDPRFRYVDLGKRTIDFRNFQAGLGKRRLDRINFHVGLGKRHAGRSSLDWSVPRRAEDDSDTVPSDPFLADAAEFADDFRHGHVTAELRHHDSRQPTGSPADDEVTKRKVDRMNFRVGLGRKRSHSQPFLPLNHAPGSNGLSGSFNVFSSDLDSGLEKRNVDRTNFGFGLGKRSIDQYNFKFGLGKRQIDRNSFRFGLGKRAMDRNNFGFGLGKRRIDDSNVSLGLRKRERSNGEIQLGVGKYQGDRHGVRLVLIKRSVHQPDSHLEPDGRKVDDDKFQSTGNERNVDARSSDIDSGKQPMDSNNFSIGLGKRTMDRNNFGFGLGKRTMDHNNFGFGLGKRKVDRNNFGFGLGKRKVDRNNFGFGLGKRKVDRNNFGFGLGKRKVDRNNFGFGLGKRKVDRNNFGFGLGKRTQLPELTMGNENANAADFQSDLNNVLDLNSVLERSNLDTGSSHERSTASKAPNWVKEKDATVSPGMSERPVQEDVSTGTLGPFYSTTKRQDVATVQGLLSTSLQPSPSLLPSTTAQVPSPRKATLMSAHHRLQKRWSSTAFKSKVRIAPFRRSASYLDPKLLWFGLGKRGGK